MAINVKAFTPLENQKLTYAAETTSKSVGFTVKKSLGTTFLQGSSDYFPNVLRIDNQTDKSIYVKAGVGSATAANTDYEVKTGTIAYIDIGQNDFVAAIPDTSATGTVFLAHGIGKN